METLQFMVQLESKPAVFIASDRAKTVEQAIEAARVQLQAPDAKHLQTEVFKGQTLHEVIRG